MIAPERGTSIPSPERSARFWTAAIALLGGALWFSGCSARESRTLPNVLGITFGIPATDLGNYLSPNAKPDNFSFFHPSVRPYGYLLEYPNPENWKIVIQDEAPELAKKRIFRIVIARDLSRPCTVADTTSLAQTLTKRYQSGFSESVVAPHEKYHGLTFLAVDRRRMLRANIACDGNYVASAFDYLDLDRFEYKDVAEMQRLLEQTRREVKEYPSRSLK